MFKPTIAFWFSLTPLPIIWFLNILIFIRLRQVHKLSRGRKIKRPKIYTNGGIINLVSLFFVLLPAIVEWRVFVQNPNWIVVYLAAGCLNIVGLSMVFRGLNMEIKGLKRRPKQRQRHHGRRKGKSTAVKPLTVT